MAGNPDRAVVWSPRAEQDLADVWQYYSHAASAELADRLLLDINATANRLDGHELGRPRSELARGLRSFPVHPYTLFYRVTKDSLSDNHQVEVVRVLHERRDFGSALSSTSK